MFWSKETNEAVYFDMPPLTQGDRLLAGMSHLSAFVAPVLGPAVISILTMKSSAFVRRHALASFVDALTLKFLLIIAFVVSISISIAQVAGKLQSGESLLSQEALMQMGIKLIVTWIILGIVALWDMVKTIRQAIRALTGVEPTGYAARFASKWVPLSAENEL